MFAMWISIGWDMKLTKLIETCRKFWAEVIGILRWIDWILLDCGNSFWHPLVPLIVAGWTQLIFLEVSCQATPTRIERQEYMKYLHLLVYVHHLNLFYLRDAAWCDWFCHQFALGKMKPHITGAEVNPPLAAYTQQLHLHPSRGKNLGSFWGMFCRKVRGPLFSHFLLSFFFPNEWFSN